ncbi:MFS-type transporter SLC18B1-like isoform X2 [Tachypleus tridentatus]|uniref:MFS-type transporter SLC18B1-like isoform X2 n=1 Tax=Tachypleus tridentatus TaxID=6853 RepID=UPI003FD5787D
METDEKSRLLEENSVEIKVYKSTEEDNQDTDTESSHKDKITNIEPKKKEKYTSVQWLTLLTLAYGNFCIGASISLQAPFFPQEISHVTPSFMLNSGISVIGVSSILFGILDRAPNGNPFVYLAIFVRIAEGIGSAAAKTSSYSIIALEFPNSVATTFSLLETCLGIGLITGPTLGGALYQVGGYELPFITAGMALLVDSVVIFFVLPELDSSRMPKKTGELFKFYKNIGIGLDCLVVFTTFNCIGFNHATLEPHLRQFNLTPFLLGSTFMISGFVYGVFAPFWGWLCDRMTSTRILTIIGCTFMCIVELFIGPAMFIPIDTQLWLVLVSLSIFGLACGSKLVPTFIGALRNTVDRGFPNDLTTYGLVSSMFTSTMALGAFVGPTVGGYLLDVIGFRKGTTLLFGIELGVMAIVCIYYTSTRIKRAETKPKTDNREPLWDSLSTAIIAEGVRTKSFSM